MHVGVHEEVHQLMRAQRLFPEEMSAFEILRQVNPALAEDFEMWRDGPGQEQSDSFREQCESSLVRVGGWAVSAGRFDEFRQAKGLDDLFAMQIETQQRVKMNPRELREVRARGLPVDAFRVRAHFAARGARRIGGAWSPSAKRRRGHRRPAQGREAVPHLLALRDMHAHLVDDH